MLWHSIYLQVVKVHLFNYSISRVSYVQSSRTTDESLHFTVLPCHLRKCRRPVYIVIQDISYDQNFLQRSTRNFEIRRQVLRVKIKWRNSKRAHTRASLSLSLSLSTCRSADALWFSRKDVHEPVSLSLSLSLCLHLQKTVWIQIRPEWNSGKNVSPI